MTDQPDRAAATLLREVFAEPAAPRPLSERSRDLHALIDAALVDLARWVDAGRQLVDTRQAPSVPFLTPDARARADDQVRAERRARRANELAGLEIPGESPAPLNVAATSIEDETRAYLDDLAVRIRSKIRAAGLCWIGERTMTNLDQLARRRDRTRHTTASTSALISQARDLVPLVRSADRLERIHRDVDDLATRAKRVVNGEHRTRHTDPCPHCGRMTLVVDLDAGVITCDTDPDTGRRHLCRCPDRYCPCRRRPITHRHTWHRAEKAHKPTSWRGLRRDQTTAARHHQEDTIARAALDRVRQIHTPTWTDDQGTEHTHYVTARLDQLPTDHQCLTDPADVGDTCDPTTDQHVGLLCVECLTTDENGTTVAAWWPCNTTRAIDHEPDTDTGEPT